MDLSLFPKPVQNALEPLMTIIDELYRDYPEFLVTVLRKVLGKYEGVTVADSETQTEAVSDVRQDECLLRKDVVGQVSSVEVIVLQEPSSEARTEVEDELKSSKDSVAVDDGTSNEGCTTDVESPKSDHSSAEIEHSSGTPQPETTKADRTLQMKQYNKFRKRLKEKKSKEDKVAVPAQLVDEIVPKLTQTEKKTSEAQNRVQGWAFEPSSFVYDKQSKNFYNAQHNCFYMADSQLYYFVETKAYYTYDSTEKCLKFYSSAAPQIIQVPGAESGPTSSNPSSQEVPEERSPSASVVEEEDEDMDEGELPDSPQPASNVPSDANVWNLDNLAEDVRSAAQGILDQNFVYEPTSGTYYNAVQQCYYYPDSKMYFYVQNNAYYLYDEKDQCLKFYYSADLPKDTTAAEPKSPAANVGNKSPREDLEEGEIDETEPENVMSPASIGSWTPVISKEPTKNNPNVEPPEYVAPCIRLTVKNTKIEGITQGQLYIITRCGGTLGSDDNNDIVLDDSHVDTLHVTFKYRFKKGKGVYTVVCVGSNDGSSENGTFLDGKVMKQHKPYQLKHESILRVGDTKLSCHIHHGNETCEDCEPSCLGFMAGGGPAQPIPGGGSLKARHTQEMNQIKRKFGINGNLPTPKLPKGYEDKSKIRRDTVGSSHDSEKTEVASTEEHIRSDNKGFAMMQKMGWKEGGAVGRSGEGMTSPVDVAVRSNRLGLGCAQTYVPQVKPSAKAASINATKKRYEACKWQVSSDVIEKDED